MVWLGNDLKNYSQCIRKMAKKRETSVEKGTKKAKKVTKNVEEPVEAQVVVEEPVEETVQTPEKVAREVSVDSVDGDFNALVESLSGLVSSVPKGELTKSLRTILKQCKNLQKDVRRVVKKKKRNSRPGNQTGGLMKPVAISNELADFLGVERGTEMSRTEVTRKMAPLLQKMQNPENKRVLVPNKELTKLLKYNSKEHGELYYYTVQKLIQPHFK